MPKGRPITLYEREKIATWIRIGKKKLWMAENLGRDYSVIKREIKRNSGKYNLYMASVAQAVAERRTRKTNVRKLEKLENLKLKKFVIEKIKEDWSPEQIAGALKENLPTGVSETVSHESIYGYIYNYSEKHFHLYEHLRTGRKKRRRKFSRKKRGIAIKNRVSIHVRPAEISKKKNFGHWENDLVEFGRRQKAVLSVKYERKSMLCRLHKLESRHARGNEDSIAETIESFPYDWFRSVTRDNGKENAEHEKTLLDFNVPTYFCDPYSSWQKGGIENLNKLIRQYLPKRCDFAKMTDDDILKIQEKLNSRPRKSNNYLTPNEIFALNS
ncbi:MAG: IS30 family transposase [Parcubacteria group bacterium]|jgi:IS30 family transposase